jgi:hypothetical protein
MIVEEGEYAIKPGKLRGFVETYWDHGLQIPKPTPSLRRAEV